MVLRYRVRYNTFNPQRHLILVFVLPRDWQLVDPQTVRLLRVKIRLAEEVTNFSADAYSVEFACDRSKILHRVLPL